MESPHAPRLQTAEQHWASIEHGRFGPRQTVPLHVLTPFAPSTHAPMPKQQSSSEVHRSPLWLQHTPATQSVSPVTKPQHCSRTWQACWSWVQTGGRSRQRRAEAQLSRHRSCEKLESQPWSSPLPASRLLTVSWHAGRAPET